MKKLHFLISISSDTENLYGIRFFKSFFGKTDNCEVTLFHICRLDSRDYSESLLEVWKGPDKESAGRLGKVAEQALRRARRNLREHGVNINQMKTKTVQERYGKVKDILREGAEGLYDAMILGRRATYALQWVFGRPGDEIPLALLQDTSLNCPMWICSEPEEGRKNVLLCVDDSESSLRAADHVGYILGHTPQHSVTVFHVTSSRGEDSEKLFAKINKILLSHNLKENRIHWKSSWALAVSSAILAEKNNGRYAAVAIGAQDGTSDKSMLNRFGLKGGTATTLITKISKAALWICP